MYMRICDPNPSTPPLFTSSVYDEDTDTQQMVYDIQDGIAREAGDFQEGGWSAILHPTTPVFYALLAGVGIAGRPLPPLSPHMHPLINPISPPYHPHVTTLSTLLSFAYSTVHPTAIQQLSGIEAITSYFLFIFDEAEVTTLTPIQPYAPPLINPC
jgi:hypothetical protein